MISRSFQNSNISERKTRHEHLNLSKIEPFMVHESAKIIFKDKIRLVSQIDNRIMLGLGRWYYNYYIIRSIGTEDLGLFAQGFWVVSGVLRT